jgi:iron complex outermembrane receptor protein
MGASAGRCTSKKNDLRLHATFASLTSAGLLSIAAPALAADDARLEEIIVTASKRDTNLMQTPLSISAFTQDFIDREGVRTARDLSGAAPNVQLSTGPDSGTAATIRGITSTDFTEVGEGAVAIHFDGFYSPRPQGTLALMYDLERVEILRGPQGTLFGMNSPGGTINIIPAKPDFGSSFAKVEAAVGNYDERQARGMFNLAVTDNFALRAGFMVDKHDGMLSSQGKDVTGDQYVTLKVVIGASDDAELAKFLEDWAKQHPTDPRRAMGQGTAQGAAA